jgi:hypothetical protein
VVEGFGYAAIAASLKKSRPSEKDVSFSARTPNEYFKHTFLCLRIFGGKPNSSGFRWFSDKVI